MHGPASPERERAIGRMCELGEEIGEADRLLPGLMALGALYFIRAEPVAVDEQGELSGWVNPEKCRPAVFAGEHVNSDGLELDAQLLKRPAHTDRASRSELE
jgi:hypothetical protein